MHSSSNTLIRAVHLYRMLAVTDFRERLPGRGRGTAWSREVLPARRPATVNMQSQPRVKSITVLEACFSEVKSLRHKKRLTKAILLFEVRLYDAAVTDLSVLGVTISEEMGTRLNTQKPQKSSVLEACFSEVKSHTKKDSPKQYSYSRFVCMMRQSQT